MQQLERLVDMPSALARLSEAKLLSYARTKSPCERGCPMAATCKAERLACTSFLSFCNSGRIRAPRTPTRQIFNKIFNEEDRKWTN